MAVLLIPHVIRKRLDHRINYAVDEEKAWYGNMLLASTLNCSAPEYAFEEMQDVKNIYGKDGGILGFSFIQSFDPGEISPEKAHELGVLLAEEYFGSRYQVVIGTHLDHDHIHNHIIINSVSFMDGLKYRNKLHYLTELREINDKLCLEQGLSVISPNPTPEKLTHKQWREKKQGIPTPKDMLRGDIDAAIAASFSFPEFVKNMNRMGYQVKYGRNITHMTILPPGAERARRVHKLGDQYTEAAIRERIERNRQRVPVPANKPRTRTRYSSFFDRNKATKLTGIRALYYKYLYQLGAIRKRPYAANRRTAYVLRNEISQMERYCKQFRLLNSHHISTMPELQSYRDGLQTRMDVLLELRDGIKRKLRTVEGKAVQGKLQGQCAAINKKIRPLRDEIRHCKEIEERSQHIRHQNQRLREYNVLPERAVRQKDYELDRL